MLIARVVVFSFNNYEGRKRPSKINFGETMKDLIANHEWPIYLLHKPRKTLYYVSSTDMMIKQKDDSWVAGISYISTADGKIYARPYEMFNKENWEVLDRKQALEMIKKGEITL